MSTPKGYVQYDLIYITLLKRQNYKNGEQIDEWLPGVRDRAGMGYGYKKCMGDPCDGVFSILTVSMTTSWLWSCTDSNFAKCYYWRELAKGYKGSPTSRLKHNDLKMKSFMKNTNIVVQSLNHIWLFVTPMDCSMPGFPVLHHFLEYAQTHVHWVSDAIQPSHPLSPPSPLALNHSQHRRLFQWVNSSHQVAKVLELQLQHQLFQWISSVDFL